VRGLARLARPAAWLLVLAVALPAVAQEDQPPAPPSPPSQEEDDERPSFWKRSPSRLLELPRYLLELPWYPIEQLLNVSERVDLPNRIRDLFYFNDERTAGWFPNIVYSSSEDVEGLGLSLFHHNLFGRQQEADAAFIYKARDQLLVRGAYTINPTPGHPIFFKAQAAYVHDNEVPIYVRAVGGSIIPGADTTLSDRSSYAARRTGAGVTAGRQITAGLDLSTHLRGFRAKVTQGGPGFPPLPAGLAGLGEEIGMIGGGVGVVWDRRDSRLRPFIGALVTAEVEALAAPHADDDGTRFGYTRYRLEAQELIPLFKPHRMLVLRQTLHRVDRLGSGEIPFYELPVLDFVENLRSFDRNRFQDRGALTVSVEYHYPIWRTWDAVLFVDAGEVFDHYADIAIDAVQLSEGAAIRFMTDNRLLFVLQYGIGREGDQFLFSFQQFF